METNRETKKITTPTGVELVVYSYATGREVRAIENKYYSKAKLDVVAGQPKITDMDLSATHEVEKEMITTLVVSINNDTVDILNKVLDLRQVDFEFVISELNEITKKK